MKWIFLFCVVTTCVHSPLTDASGTLPNNKNYSERNNITKPSADKPAAQCVHSTSTCHNVCDSCINSQCVGEESVCQCFEHYERDPITPTVCNPICTPSCSNGICVAPNVCSCHHGYKLLPNDHFKCVPTPNITNEKNRCEFSLTNAVSYEKRQNCFKFKVKSNLTEERHCPLLTKYQPYISSNSINTSYFNLTCSLETANSTRTSNIRCFLSNFTRVSNESSDAVRTSGNWANVTLTIEWDPETNISTTKSDMNLEPKEWLLNTDRTVSYCGNELFSARIEGIKSPASTLNTAAMYWIGAVLLIIFTIFSITGMGAFLWVRHRRLNNPLNYKENMGKGYNNHVYDNTGVLASDDEEEE